MLSKTNISRPSLKNFLSRLNPILCVFIICALYWIYLAFATSIDIKHDAINFQTEGQSLYEKGLVYFLQNSPHDIFYPFLITIARYIADSFSLSSHLMAQKWIQIIFLFTTMFMLHKTLAFLNLAQGIKICTLLYCGFSPAIINATFSSYSEIATLPFALSIVFVSAYGWNSVQLKKGAHIISSAVLLGILFMGISLSEETYRYIIAKLYPICFFIFSLNFLFRKRYGSFFRSVLWISIFISSYILMMRPYDHLQKKYQTEDLFLTKGLAQLYGGTLVRSSNLSPERILSYLAYVPGENVVKKLFGEEAFNFWFYQQYDYGPQLQQEISQHGSSEDIKKIFYQRIISNVLRNPLQYMLLTVAEGMKMLFWESTRVGFVVYPHWLEKIYAFTPFKDSLRLFVFLITLVALIFTSYYLWKNQSFLFIKEIKTAGNQRYIVVLASAMLIAFNIAVYSPFIIVTRYAIPLAPLYLILISVMMQERIEKSQHQKEK